MMTTEKQPIRVLVIEDDPEDAAILRRHLKHMAFFHASMDHVLDWTQDVLHGLTDHDIVLLDYRLGSGLTAQDVLQEIRETDNDIPVIVLTGVGDEQIAVEIMKAGATDYMVKEIVSAGLLDKAIRHALADRAVALEKSRLDATLRESEKRYRSLVDTLTEYLYSVKVEEGQVVPVLHSPGCLKVTGYAPEEYRKNPNLWLEMVFPEDRPRVVEHFESLMDGQTVEPIEHRIIHKDRQMRWIRNSPVPRLDEANRLVGYEGLISDITERKLAEEKIQDLARFPAEDPNAVLRIAKDGTVLYVNAAGVDLFKDWDCKVGQTAPEFWQQVVTDALGSASRREIEVEHKDRVFSFVVTPLNEVDYVNLYGRDITERKRAEEELDAKNRQLEQANIRLAQLARADELTGLANRRRFYEMLASEFERIRRYANPLSLVMCDIDHFKQVNDTCGHVFGDQTLQEVAALLDAGSRQVDTVARDGGEEFMIILPGTTSGDAFRLAERLRRSLSEAIVTNGKHQVKVTASFGVAGMESGRRGTVDDLVRMADEALYAAKRAGRNCTVTWDQIAAKGAAVSSNGAEQIQELQKTMAALSVNSQEALFQAIMGLAQAQEARD
ncbi:MAG: diguanylate cyclase, partial [Phycisphaerae bacterium]|nr:diguanylate cyclase [Phycisphaerae bacterium]